jgi:HSP20 family molecular chaperone IbpA
MAIIPWRRSNERWLVEREGDQFSYLRQQINRVFDDFWDEPWPVRGEALSGFAPRVDVTETDKDVKICAEIPGSKRRILT